MLKFALIGFGGLGRSIFDIIENDPSIESQCTGILVKKEKDGYGTENPNFVFSIDELLDGGPDIVVECAGHDAVRDYGQRILAQGGDFAPASIGVLADDSLLNQLTTTARASGAKIILPAGAIGGVDALAAAKESGLIKVTYRSRKPAMSWRGTPAEEKLDLPALTSPAIHFRGSACDAAKLYPKNANVAATIALAGAGFENTHVELIADPTTTKNIHELEVSSNAGVFSIKLYGNPLASNPKTSMLTACSFAHVLKNRDRAIVI